MTFIDQSWSTDLTFKVNVLTSETFPCVYACFVSEFVKLLCNVSVSDNTTIISVLSNHICLASIRENKPREIYSFQNSFKTSYSYIKKRGKMY